MLKDPIIVRAIGLALILASILFGRIWWKQFNKHVEDTSAKPEGDFIYGLSFISVLLGFFGIAIIYFGRFQ